MAGSLNHIIEYDGTFTMDTIENMGDAHEALEECFHIIRILCGDDMSMISAACDELNFPDPFMQRVGEERKQPLCIGGKDAYAVTLEM